MVIFISIKKKENINVKEGDKWAQGNISFSLSVK